MFSGCRPYELMGYTISLIQHYCNPVGYNHCIIHQLLIIDGLWTNQQYTPFYTSKNCAVLHGFMALVFLLLGLRPLPGPRNHWYLSAWTVSMLGAGGCRRDPLVNVSMESHHLERFVGGIPTPNIKVSWDDDIPICIMENFLIHVRNPQHQWSSVNQGFLWESGPKIAVTSMTRGLNSWSSWNKPTMSSP